MNKSAALNKKFIIIIIIISSSIITSVKRLMSDHQMAVQLKLLVV